MTVVSDKERAGNPSLLVNTKVNKYQLALLESKVKALS
jgi:hypothetical protein